MVITWGISLVACCVLLLAIPVLLEWRAGTGLAPSIAIAGLRSIVQLVVVALLIVFAISHLWATLLVVVAMFTMAVLTSVGRVGVSRRQAPMAALAMGAGLLPVLAVTVFSGTIPFKGVALIPIAGVVMNNIMSVHTLGGRNSFRALEEQHEIVEGYLALGLPAQTAAAQVLHPRIKESLIPGIDSVKTAGIVTLPGAFLGVMLGGGSPMDATMAQVVVLLGVLCAQSCTALAQYELIIRGRLLRDDLRSLFRPSPAVAATHAPG
ncbi:ABC transporter permease [Yimella radicis]